MPSIEEFENFIEAQGGNAGLADKMGVSPATVSAWRTGRNNIKLEYKRLLREKLKYAGKFPDEGDRPITPEDLQALGRDLVRVVNQSEGRLSEEIQTLGAILFRIQERLGLLSDNSEARPSRKNPNPSNTDLP